MTRDDIIRGYEEELENWGERLDKNNDERLNKQHLIDFIIGSLLARILFKDIDMNVDIIFAFKKRENANNIYDVKLLVGVHSWDFPTKFEGYIELEEFNVNFYLSNYMSSFNSTSETVLENDCVIYDRVYKIIDNNFEYLPEALQIVRNRKKEVETHDYRQPFCSINTDR
jgi:hypothetical protein